MPLGPLSASFLDGDDLAAPGGTATRAQSGAARLAGFAPPIRIVRARTDRKGRRRDTSTDRVAGGGPPEESTSLG